MLCIKFMNYTLKNAFSIYENMPGSTATSMYPKVEKILVPFFHSNTDNYEKKSFLKNSLYKIVYLLSWICFVFNLGSCVLNRVFFIKRTLKWRYGLSLDRRLVGPVKSLVQKTQRLIRKLRTNLTFRYKIGILYFKLH